MIPVQLNKANFEYDIHSLVKAFFPGEDVLVSTEKKETDERISFHIDIEYIENKREEMKNRREQSRTESGSALGMNRIRTEK